MFESSAGELMKTLLYVGLVLVVLGVTLLFVPLPYTERHAIKAGGLSVGVQTTHSEKAPPVVSVALILGGVVLAVASRRARS